LLSIEKEKLIENEEIENMNKKHKESNSKSDSKSQSGNEDSLNSKPVEMRTLRSSDKKKLYLTSSKKKQMKCHLCREKQELISLVKCKNSPNCHHSFCFKCLNKFFKAEIKKEHIKTSNKNWVCFVCRGMCKCVRCIQELRRELAQIDGEEVENSTHSPKASSTEKIAMAIKVGGKENSIIVY
jgi:hypothetical protein